MKFSSFPIEEDQDRHVSLKTRCIVAVSAKRYWQTPDRKIKEKILSNLFRITRPHENDYADCSLLINMLIDFL